MTLKGFYFYRPYQIGKFSALQDESSTRPRGARRGPEGGRSRRRLALVCCEFDVFFFFFVFVRGRCVYIRTGLLLIMSAVRFYVVMLLNESQRLPGRRIWRGELAFFCSVFECLIATPASATFLPCNDTLFYPADCDYVILKTRRRC